jgi:hypothetical protein
VLAIGAAVVEGRGAAVVVHHHAEEEGLERLLPLGWRGTRSDPPLLILTDELSSVIDSPSSSLLLLASEP